MNSHQVISALHVFVLGPMLIAIGAGWLPQVPRMAVAALGAFIALYHGFRAWSRDWPWINVLHALVVGPVLIAYGLTDARYMSELVLMLGFAAVGYHAYYLLKY
jgi:hypothetical protein